jgi:hypothetical protein
MRTAIIIASLLTFACTENTYLDSDEDNGGAASVSESAATTEGGATSQPVATSTGGTTTVETTATGGTTAEVTVATVAPAGYSGECVSLGKLTEFCAAVNPNFSYVLINCAAAPRGECTASAVIGTYCCAQPTD